ncbi:MULTISPECIES: hypothetical protein [Streptomyces]|uniref:hypothetical protein n=1 Tax=Streptomyces TaxID=1883 RepID=UPI00201CC6DA|nr:hypothetical protein [Streptomyces panaciradicis]MCL6672699.1 hypothetical protein [Streptomyces panaciradicis]
MAQAQGTGKGDAGDGSATGLNGLVSGALGRLGRWGGLVFLLAGLALSGWGAYQGSYLAGWAGTHGTLTVQRCEVSYPNNASRSSRKNRRPVRCEGVFVADGGADREAGASVRVRQRYAAGTELSVQRAGGEYLQSGLDRAWRYFAAFFGGWVLTGLGLFCLATGYAPFGRSRVSYDGAWEAAGRGRTRVVVLGMTGVGSVGGILSFLISYLV